MSSLFMSEAYDYLNQVPADIREPTKMWENAICRDQTLELKV